MPIINVRELRQQTSELLRKLREEQAEYVITYRGEPVALLLPLDADEVEQALVKLGERDSGQAWETYLGVAERARDAWPKALDTESLLDEVRR